jgi:polyphosphate kinase
MLAPGVKGVSENIKVISIVDRFLEHARAFYFYNGGAEEAYLSSADWMSRNLERRVELMFPIEQKDLKKRVLSILKTCCEDTSKAHILTSSGTYEAPRTGTKKLNRSQRIFYEKAVEAAGQTPEENRTEFSVRRKPPKGGKGE